MRLNEEAKKQHIVCDKEKEKWALTKRLICFQNCKKVGRYLIDNPQHRLSSYLQLDSKVLPSLDTVVFFLQVTNCQCNI